MKTQVVLYFTFGYCSDSKRDGNLQKKGWPENSSKENHKQTPVLGEVLLSLVSAAFVHERERVLVEVFSGHPFIRSPHPLLRPNQKK